MGEIIGTPVDASTTVFVPFLPTWVGLSTWDRMWLSITHAAS
jgi:hypothetical protein